MDELRSGLSIPHDADPIRDNGVMIGPISFSFLGLVLLMATPALQAPGADTNVLPSITTQDLLQLRTIREVDVDRSGRFAIISIESFAATKPLEGVLRVGDYGIQRHLFHVDLVEVDSAPRQLTHGERLDSSPALSPNGLKVAFVRVPAKSEDGEKEKPRGQVWVLPLDGGEARQVTTLEHGAGRPSWAPDGRSLLVESTLSLEEIIAEDGPPGWSPTRPGKKVHDETDRLEAARNEIEPNPAGSLEEIRSWLEGNARARDPRVVDRIAFQGEQELEERTRLRQIFEVTVEPDGSSPRRIGRGAVERFDAVHSVDGRQVIMAARSGEVHPDAILESRIEQFTIEPPALETATVLLDMPGWALSDPLPGPDGSLVAFTGSPVDEPFYRGRQLGLMPVAGGEPIWATSGANLSVNEFCWANEAARVLFTAPDRGAVPLFAASPATLEPVDLIRVRDGLPTQVGAFDAGGNALVWVESSASNPSVLRSRIAGEDRMVHDANPWITNRRISRPTEGWVDRPDGKRIQYWQLPPVGLEEGDQAPLVLAIHGGPSAMWGQGESSMWFEWQLAASWGFGVVYCNPRGSGGYGEAFQRANHQDWGPGPASDCLSVLDEACRREWVDDARLVVTGGSYGGFLTAWMIAHDDRFKAAVAQRGVYDLGTFFGEGNAFRLVEWAFGGQPFDDRFREVMDRNSPFQDVARIRTPLLILHGEQDLRTGVSQSAMMYRALKMLDRPVEYVLYPKAGHDLSRSGDPIQRMDRLDRILEFFTRFVSTGRPTPRVAISEDSAGSAGGVPGP